MGKNFPLHIFFFSQYTFLDGFSESNKIRMKRTQFLRTQSGSTDCRLREASAITLLLLCRWGSITGKILLWLNASIRLV
jgi:hypothetical protein